MFEKAVDALADMIAPTPKLTPQQAKEAHQAADEKAAQAAIEAARRAVEAEYDELAFRQKTEQQEKDRRLAQTLGTNPTAEANLGRDEFDRQRQEERERERDR